MAIEAVIRGFYLGLVPYISLGIAVILLQFFFEYLFAIVDGLLKRPLRSFMQNRLRKILQVLPNFDSFLTFLLSMFIIAPLITILIRDILNPFLQSLSNNFAIMLISPLVLLVVVYFAFEQWYSKIFRKYL